MIDHPYKAFKQCTAASSSQAFLHSLTVVGHDTAGSAVSPVQMLCSLAVGCMAAERCCTLLDSMLENAAVGLTLKTEAPALASWGTAHIAEGDSLSNKSKNQ